MTPERAFSCMTDETIVLAKNNKPGLQHAIIDTVSKCQCCGDWSVRIVAPDEWHISAAERQKDDTIPLANVVEISDK